MSTPLVILAIFAIFFGYVTKDLFIGLGSGFFADNSIFIHPTHEIMLDTEFAVPTLFKILPLVFTISLSIIAIILSEFTPKLLIRFKFSRLGYNLFSFFNQRFFIEMFYNNYVTNFMLNLGGQTTRVLDKGSVELIGPYGLEKVLVRLSNNISSLSTGRVTDYALYILMGFIFYLLILFKRLTMSLILLMLLGLFLLTFVYYIFIFKNYLSEENYVINVKRSDQVIKIRHVTKGSYDQESLGILGETLGEDFLALI